MSLFGLKIGNKTIDRSKSLRENINETILENITNSNYAVRTSASINQSIDIDCSDAYKSMLTLYGQNPAWGPPQTSDEFAKGCSLIGASLDAEIKLNVDSNNAIDFSTDLERNIKKDFQQMNESIKDKNWVEVGGFNTNVNESENIRRIIDNVRDTNIKNIIFDTVTNSNINQSINIKFGTARDIALRGKIALIVTAVSDSIVKNVDKTFLDTKLYQLDKTQETDQISRGITGMFGDLMGTVRTGMVSGFGIFVIFCLFIGFIIYIQPQLVCAIPGINTMMSGFCSNKNVKSAHQSDLENKAKKYEYDERRFIQQGYPPQGYPPQGYPPQGYPPQGYPPQGYPSQGYPSQGYPPQRLNNTNNIQRISMPRTYTIKR